MAYVNDLADLFASTVTWYPLSSRDEYGVPTYGAGTQYNARVVRRHRLARDGQGDQVVSTAQAWIEGTPAIAPTDKVTLADGSSPPIIAIERYDDEHGPCYTKVLFR